LPRAALKFSGNWSGFPCLLSPLLIKYLDKLISEEGRMAKFSIGIDFGTE